MEKRLIILLIISLVLPLVSSLTLCPNNLDPLTNYNFIFNITNSTNDVILSYSNSATTTNYGFTCFDIPLSGLGNQVGHQLKYYRDGNLIKTYNFSEMILNSLRVNEIIVKNNISADWINAKLNYSNIQNAPNFIDYWDDLNSYNSTQMEKNTNNDLQVKESWFSSLWNSIFGSKTTDDLTEGSKKYYNQSDVYINHSSEGYIKDGNTNWDNLYGYISSWLLPNPSNDWLYNDSNYIYFNESKLTNVCLSNGTNCIVSASGGWQPNNSTENNTYNTTGDVNANNVNAIQLLSAELQTNGNFASGFTGWTQTNWETYGGGARQISETSGDLSSTITIEDGVRYVGSFKITDMGNGDGINMLQGGVTIAQRTSVGTTTFDFVASGTDAIIFRGQNAESYTENPILDDVTIKKYIGGGVNAEGNSQFDRNLNVDGILTSDNILGGTLTENPTTNDYTIAVGGYNPVVTIKGTAQAYLNMLAEGSESALNWKTGDNTADIRWVRLINRDDQWRMDILSDSGTGVNKQGLFTVDLNAPANSLAVKSTGEVYASVGMNATYFKTKTGTTTINATGVFTNKIHATTSDPKLMVYSPTSREEVQILDTDVPIQKKGINQYFNKVTGQMESWNTITGDILDINGKVISNMNSLGTIKSGYYLNYEDNSFYKTIYKDVQVINGTELKLVDSKVNSSSLFETKIVNVTSLVKSTCYKADTVSMNIVSYSCNKTIVTGTKTINQLKNNPIVGDDGKFYQEVPIYRTDKVEDTPLKVNIEEAVE